MAHCLMTKQDAMTVGAISYHIAVTSVYGAALLSFAGLWFVLFPVSMPGILSLERRVVARSLFTLCV